MSNIESVKENENVIHRIIHLRDRNANGVVQPKGGATISCRYDKETKVLDFAVALCSRKDAFSKKLGRQISEGRLQFFLKHPEGYHKLAYSSEVPTDVRFINVINAKVRDLLDDEDAGDVVDWSEDIGNLQDFSRFAEDTIEYTRKRVAQSVEY